MFQTKAAHFNKVKKKKKKSLVLTLITHYMVSETKCAERWA
jgi:hypothetical protein